MKILIALKNFFAHLLRRILQIIFSILTTIVCVIIFIVEFEPNTRGKATSRKAKRIRRLTKFKLYAYKYLKPFWQFMHHTYLENLYNKFSFLIEK